MEFKEKEKMICEKGGLRATLLHFVSCLASLGHLTADKREIKDFPKLTLATSFIPKTLGESQTANIVKRIKL